MSAKQIKLREKLIARDGNICHYCHNTLMPNQQEGYDAKGASIDHVIPKSQGGTDDLTNLVLACRKCNLEKKTRDYGEFAFRKGMDIFHLWMLMGDES